MSIKETILEILGDMHPDIDFESEQNLVTDKVLDSFDLISLATELFGCIMTTHLPAKAVCI